MNLDGTGHLLVDYNRDRNSFISMEGLNILWKNKTLDLRFQLSGSDEKWSIDRLQCGPFSLGGAFQIKEEKVCLSEAKMQWQDVWEVNFGGDFGLSFPSFFNVDRFEWKARGGEHSLLSLPMSGTFLGKGSLLVDMKGMNYAIDFKAEPFRFTYGTSLVDNVKPIHIYFSSEQGLRIRGIDSLIKPSESVNAEWKAQIGHVKYDFSKKRWIFQRAHVLFPAAFLANIGGLPPTHPGSFIFRISLSQPRL